MTDEVCQDLLEAIFVQAGKDYYWALKTLDNPPNDEEKLQRARTWQKECEWFLGDHLASHIKKKYEEDKKCKKTEEDL